MAVRDALQRITDFRVTEASALVASLVRRPVDQVTGATLRDIFPSSRIDDFVSRFAAVLATGSSQTHEYPILGDALDASWIRQTATREAEETLLVTVEDLTAERLQAVREEVSTRLRELLFEKASDGIVLVTPDGRVAEANTAFATMVKLERDALVGLRIPDHLDCPTWGESADKSFHCQLRAADQSWWAVAVRETPLPYGFRQLVFRDRSALEASEGRLRKSEEHFRSAFEESAVGMALLGNDGTTLQVNSALATMLGYSAEEALRTQWTAILHPDELATAGAVLREVGAGRLANSSDERRCIRRDGVLIWTQMTVAGVRGPAGTPEHLIVQVEDISERKRLEASRHEVEERLALVLQATRDGIWDWDVVTGRIHYGPQWFGMLGYPAEGQVGELSVFSQLVHPEDVIALMPLVERHLAGPGTEYDVTFRMRHAAGHWVWIRARGRAVARDADGRATRMVGTHTDVTHERELEEQVRHSQKMDAVGKLAGGVAHDFNNLLTAIGATTELLLTNIPPGAAHHDDLQNIALAAGRAKALTRQLLAFSRQEIEQAADVPVDTIIAKVAPLLHRLLEPSQEIAVELNAKDAMLRLDPANLELALLNLVANARDAMPHGGTVTIRTDVVAHTGHPNVMVTVRDTGIGMSADVRDRIFEPFFTTKPQGKGTGLGMPTVYGFVRRLQGTVQVESAPGAGTTVQILLPVITGPTPSMPDTMIPDARAPTRVVQRVLLVDDDTVVRRSTQRLLEHRGIEVVGVASAEAALAELVSTSTPFDVVLSDHAMPGRTGHQLLEEIGIRYPAQRVVLMSGFADDDQLRRTFGSREVPFLAKPFTLQELMQALGS